MKRTRLEKHLANRGCVLYKEGCRHSIFRNKINGLKTTIPRHTEINPFLAKKICRDLCVEEIREK